jgi:hypothetical protein
LPSPAVALSAFQLLIGARVGVAVPAAPLLLAAPSFGLMAEASLTPQLGLDAAFDAASNALVQNGRALGVLRQSSATLGVHYRLDVAKVVPYLALGLVGSSTVPAPPGQRYSLEGALGFGVHVPIAKRFFAGASARYRFSLPGLQLPTHQAYGAHVGWRWGDF